MCKMFSIKQWIQATILVSVSRLYAQPPPKVEGASFNPDLPSPDLVRTDNSYIREVLNRMANKGDQYLKKNNITANQILVIAVLSASEVHAKKPDISDDMIEYLPNESIDNLPPYFQKADVHGEMLAIYFKSTIELLSKRVKDRNSKDTRPPYAFIFSHYIPCACVANVHYSCAEELANLGRVNRNRYKIIVGYRDYWVGTNLNFAEKLLQEGGIHTAMNISSGQVLDKRLKIEPEIYQEKFTVCLRNLKKMPEDTVACFINTFTKYCIKDGKDLYGYMTQFTKAKMHECVEEYVKGLPLEFYARCCSLDTLSRTMRLMLGRPTRMCEASWTSTPDDLNWKELYSDFSDAMPSSFSEFSDKKTSLEDLSIYCANYVKDIKNYEGHTQNSYQRTKLNKLKNDIDYEISQKKKNKQQKARTQTRNGQSRENTYKRNAKIRNKPT